MNNTLYTQLSDLGFGEWLRKKDSLFWAALKNIDESDIDNLFRTMLNALAFRWLREEKKVFVLVSPVDDWTSWTIIIYAKDCMSPFFQAYPTPTSEIPEYDQHPLAEHEALNKALEILSKGGSDE